MGCWHIANDEEEEVEVLLRKLMREAIIEDVGGEEFGLNTEDCEIISYLYRVTHWHYVASFFF
jgi:hypothetical protein